MEEKMGKQERTRLVSLGGKVKERHAVSLGSNSTADEPDGLTWLITVSRGSNSTADDPDGVRVALREREV
jgi:hypothetical protein